MVAHVCHGQFFYIDDQESKYWLQTNFSSFNKLDIFPSNKWLTYGINKNIRQKEGHSFGAFIHLKNQNNLKGIIQNILSIEKKKLNDK